MRRYLHRISALLIAVLLATVLSPTFGWEASAGPDAHERAFSVTHGSGAAHEDHAVEPDRNSIEAAAHQDGCAAHMLGHLVADICTVAVLSLSTFDSSRLARPLAAILAEFQETIYRPPLARLLA